jgi:signal transduction histidine kinase
MVPFTWDQIAVLVRDITARKMAHDKAQQHARELVHKNEELTHALTDAQESKAIKTELIQKVSLELHTPMSGIVGMTAKVLDTKLDREQRQIVEAVRTSSQTVLSILSNILDASRLESRLLPVENRPFGVRDVIQKVVSGIRGHASKKGLHLEWGVAKEIPVTIQGDPVRLEKVLVNLLENGIKFTSQGQVGLEVGLAGETKEDWTLKFTVQDTGIGISSDKLPTIFDGYTRVDGGKSRAMGNSGLGLAICKQLIEMMAGGITVESSPSKGSIFQFTAVFEKCVLNPLSATESGVSYDSSGEILSWGYR